MSDQVKYTNLLRDKRVLVIGGTSGTSHSYPANDTAQHS